MKRLINVGFWRQYDIATSSTLFLDWNTTVFQSQFIDPVKSLDLKTGADSGGGAPGARPT